jgi:hypothetical protein
VLTGTPGFLSPTRQSLLPSDAEFRNQSETAGRILKRNRARFLSIEYYTDIAGKFPAMRTTVPPRIFRRTGLRAKESRKNREKNVASTVKEGKVKDILMVEDWEVAYRKECFYRGLRVLLELERDGQSQL